MFNIKTLLLVGIICSLLTSGCASYRVLTDLKPESDATLQSPAGRFYIAGLTYVFEPKPPYKYPPPEENLLRLVRQECIDRYPALFGKNQTEGIPLWVEVSDKWEQPFPLMFLCTLTLCPIVFPCPATKDRDIVVLVSPWNGRDTSGREIVQMNFHRKEHWWQTILTPLGLILIPGESDMPKGSSIVNEGPEACDTIPQVAQQVATAIAKLISTKDPAFWTTQPRLNNSSIGLPTRTGDAPGVQPLPSDTVAPF